MTPAYSYYDGGAVIVAGPSAYATFNYGVSGLTVCNGSCPSGVTHTGHVTFAFNGGQETDYADTPVPPQQTINFSKNEGDPSLSLPFTGKKVVLGGYVECSRVGTISNTNIPVDTYFSSTTTFFKAQANSNHLAVDCTYSGDGTPAWSAVPNNPYGTQGANPSPLYLEYLGIVYSSTVPPAASFNNWALPNGNLVSTYEPWQHSNGNPAPMPQQCTQLKTGLTQYNPGYIVPPQ